MEFTPQQQKVIDTRKQNILVSAAAGSGKTAVLVERIIRKITDKEQPVDIDRLLIVTFTSAAASEMRERISLAIEAKLYEDPENEHLQRQAALLHNAQITTIDSFCLFVLRNNFNDIGLDPAFRVADEGEIRLMKQDVMAELLEECFAEEQESFTALVESFGRSGSEKQLAEQVFKLYEFAMSMPWPKQWLLERRQDYRIESIEALEASPFWQTVLQEIMLRLADARQQVQEGLRLCSEPDGPYMYSEMLQADAEFLERLPAKRRQAQETDLQSDPPDALQGQRQGCLQMLYEMLDGVSFPALSRKRDGSVNEEKRERVKELHQQVKDAVQDIKKLYLGKPPGALLADMQEAAEKTESLIRVTLRFMERFAGKKREKNLIDFTDMEHFALDILVQPAEGGFESTAAAQEYCRHFEEIMIDEYQDSNLVQETLLSSISGEREGRHNRFMVGDVKQSIYKFRLARPELFMEKYENYADDRTPGCVRIDLMKNFRSRGEVLSSVNRVFAQLMRRELGGICYDADAALYPGAEYPAAEEDIYQTELLLYDRASEQQMPERKYDAKEQEAAMIAQKIRQLVGNFPVTDKETGKLRPASYRDMVILLRTNSGWDDVFVRVLTEAGVPAYAASKTGYFAAQEIRTLLNFLRVIDNPRQDIPLFGVLRSKELSGGFTEEELAYVRAVSTKKPDDGTQSVQTPGEKMSDDGTLYSMLCLLAETESDEPAAQRIAGKWKAFCEMLSRYRSMSAYTPVGQLFRTILTDSGYLYAITAMPGGEQRRANVEMLLTRAADFEKTSYYGLFHFLRYMEQMERYQIDYGEAGILDENADTVRIMSIHKSKGLEFPICFVAGLSKRFNMSDMREPLLLDADLGIGMEAVDLEKRLRKNTLRRAAIGNKLKKDNLGEELRVLYVAMTRAKEKLILTAAVLDAETLELEAKQDVLQSETEPGVQAAASANGMDHGAKMPVLPYSELLSAGSYLDFLLPCIRGRDIMRLSVVSAQELETAEWKRHVQMSLQERRLALMRAIQTEYDIDVRNEQAEKLRRQFSFRYPHENLRQLYTKTTVSELKKAGHEDFYAGAAELYADLKEPPAPYLPRFMQEEEAVSGTDRGSAYHRVMELLTFAAFENMPEAEWEQQIRKQLTGLKEKGRLSSFYMECVRENRIAAFLKSALAKRMMQAERKGLLFREKPFVLGIPASRLNTDFPGQETVLVQGIIDAYFEEENELVVVDYKTDRVRTGWELAERYRVQLEYYAEALERITQKKVRQKILYSFALQEEIPT